MAITSSKSSGTAFSPSPEEIRDQMIAIGVCLADEVRERLSLRGASIMAFGGWMMTEGGITGVEAAVEMMIDSHITDMNH